MKIYHKSKRINLIFKNILILGSAPDSLKAQNWKAHPFDAIICINNAWQIRPDWTHSIFPTDFPKERRAIPNKNQSLHSAEDYVPTQNKYGGFVYAGGTMAFTAAYWALDTFKPKKMFFLGCDMIYSNKINHFYGTGTADPLREDITLRSLEAKSARFEVYANMLNCIPLNLSNLQNSRLIYRRVKLEEISRRNGYGTRKFDPIKIQVAKEKEATLGYFVEDGKYWKCSHMFDKKEIDRLDSMWLSTIVDDQG